MSPYRRHVVILLPERVHLLDAAGPAQVFVAANDVGGSYRVTFFAEQGLVASHQGLALVADDQLPELDSRDLMLVAGQRSGASMIADGAGVAPGQFSASIRTALIAHHAAGGEVGSICSGARTLGLAGLLDGRSCTTHHELIGQLQKEFPLARVLMDRLFVTDDRVHTSAGVASGVDLALDLVAGDHGPRVAAAVARTLVLPLRRGAHSSQQSVFLTFRDHLSDLVHLAQDLLEARYAQRLTLPGLAAELRVSPRTLTRRFVSATGLTPLAYQTELRLDQATRLVASGATYETAAEEVGFTDARTLRALRARHRSLRTATPSPRTGSA